MWLTAFQAVPCHPGVIWFQSHCGQIQLLFAGGGEDATAKLLFQFVKAHLEELLRDKSSIFGFDLGEYLPFVGGGFCDAKSRAEIHLCLAIQKAQAPQVAKFLADY